MLLNRKSVATRREHSIQLDRSNSLARELYVYVARPHSSETPLPALNSVPGGPTFTSSFGGLQTSVAGPYGPAHQNALGQYQIISSLSPAIGTGDFTFGSQFKTPNTFEIFETICAFGSYSPGWYTTIGTGRPALYHSSFIGYANTTLSTNTWYTMFGVRRSGVFYWYLNGLEDGSNTYTSAWASSAQFTFTGNGATGRQLTGLMTWFGFWRRALIFSEIKNLTANPWLMLATAPPRTWFMLGGGVTLTPGAGSFSYSGQAPVASASDIFNSAAGQFDHSGQAATISEATVISVDAGQFDYSGQAANPIEATVMQPGAGQFEHNGQAVTPATSVTVEIGNGQFDHTGQTVSIGETTVVATEAGVLSYVGKSASLGGNLSPAIKATAKLLKRRRKRQ